MKKFIPYILAYLVIATGTLIPPYIAHQHLMSAQPPHSSIQPAPLGDIVIWVVRHYALDAVAFSAFVGLVIFFKRKFHASVTNNAA